MPLPELPLNVSRDARQEDGERQAEDLYQTHRGRKRPSRVGDLPPQALTPDGPLRWEDE